MRIRIIIWCLFLLKPIAGLCQHQATFARIDASVAAIGARHDLYAVTRIDTLPAMYGMPAMIRQETYYYDSKKNLHKIESRFLFPDGKPDDSNNVVSYFSNKDLIKQTVERRKNGTNQKRDFYIIKGQLESTSDEIPIETWMMIDREDLLYGRFKMVKRGFGFVPGVDPVRRPGTVMVEKDVAMSATEVTVAEWIIFILNNGFDETLFPDSSKISPAVNEIFRDLKKKGNLSFIAIKKHDRGDQRDFDSLGIRVTRKVEELAKQYGLKDPVMILPITGITYEQAVQYCKWQEEVINRDQLIKLKVQLPSIELYQQVITNIDSVNLKGCPIFNFQNCSCKLLTKSKGKKELVPDLDHGKALVKADAYWPTKQGLYTIQGNAAEMTSTPGVAMGGSFRHYAWESHREHRQTYSSPEEWLGFRYIITLKH